MRQRETDKERETECVCDICQCIYFKRDYHIILIWGEEGPKLQAYVGSTDPYIWE